MGGSILDFVWAKKYHILVAAVIYLAYKQRQYQKKLAEDLEKHESIPKYFDEKYHVCDSNTTKKLTAAQKVYETGKFGSFTRGDGVDIAHATFKATPKSTPSAPIPRFVIFTGWSESFIKYGEILHEVRECFDGAIDVYMVDHRGQGLSGRTNKNSQMTHVDDFHDHVLDAVYFLEHVVHAGETGPGRRPTVVMGFSMGGLVATRLALLRPDLVTKLILVCPCLLPKLNGIPPFVVYSIASFLTAIGKGEEYFPGSADAPDHRLTMPPYNIVSKSVERIKHWEDLRRDEPVTIINGMSAAHVRELVGAAITRSDMEQLNVPLLLITAEHDKFVDNAKQEELAMVHPNCRWVYVRDALHEVLQERDHLRNQALESIVQFIREG